ncbi:MAG: hypothetical protein ACYCVB_11670 [Bacilli bacterium]
MSDDVCAVRGCRLPLGGARRGACPTLAKGAAAAVALLFLAPEAVRCTTGQALSVDDGMTVFGL